MTKILFTLIRDAGRLALYAFVLGPALVLYLFVMLAASDGSLSRQFLTTFHDLTDGVPAGKVMGCINENEMANRFSPPESGDKFPPAPKAPPEVLCQRGPVDSHSWASSTDSMLRNFWIMAVRFGCGLGFISRRLSLAAQKRISPDTHSVLVLQKKEKHE
ncbi:hypothetical protein [Enterobacter sp. 638]|uniref:hypothetical protein n=1 Tax=Enterobacter sp. (strain 638) TaxID=399742 RepID=UPI0005A23A81|nr:hypothetical protein [Enterobacter sp. 638]